MQISTLQNLIISWAHQRNIIAGSSPKVQCVKLIEEQGELVHAQVRGRWEEMQDAIGDCAVLSFIILEQLGASDKPNLERFSPYRGVKDPQPTSLLYLSEWVGRLAYELNRTSYTQLQIDAVNGVLDALVEICHTHKFDFARCVTRAYDEIKARKGVILKGAFVKEADLQDILKDIDQRIYIAMSDDASERDIDELRREAMQVQELLVLCRNQG